MATIEPPRARIRTGETPGVADPYRYAKPPVWEWLFGIGGAGDVLLQAAFVAPLPGYFQCALKAARLGDWYGVVTTLLGNSFRAGYAAQLGYDRHGEDAVYTIEAHLDSAARHTVLHLLHQDTDSDSKLRHLDSAEWRLLSAARLALHEA